MVSHPGKHFGSCHLHLVVGVGAHRHYFLFYRLFNLAFAEPVGNISQGFNRNLSHVGHWIRSDFEDKTKAFFYMFVPQFAEGNFFQGI